METERRRIPTETFIEKVSELSEIVAKLNANMDSHKIMMLEIKDNQREYNRLILLVERNNVKIETALDSISRLNDRHDTCNINEVEKKIESIESKVSILSKVIGALGVGAIPIIYKLFGG